MPRLQTVLFDLDGTLLDSAPDICQAVNQMLKEDGRPLLTTPDIAAMLGDGAMELCRKALLKTGGVMADDLYPYVQRFIAHYRSLPPDPAQVFPHVRETLDFLRGKDVKLAVCTNKNESASVHILEALDLMSSFDFIAGGDTFEVHKPTPGQMTGIFDAWGVTGEGALFVGDGPRDTEASKRAGIPCIIVTHGYGVDYDDLECAAKIPSIDGFLPAARKLGFEI